MTYSVYEPSKLIQDPRKYFEKYFYADDINYSEMKAS